MATPGEIENELFKRWNDGEPVEAELVHVLQKHAFAIAWLVLGKRRPDIVNDAVHRVLTRSKSFKGKSKFNTWFHAIVENLCRSSQRKEIPQEQREVPLESVVEIAKDERLEDKIDLEKIIHRLPLPEQKLLALKLEGFSNAEISARLGVPVARVEKWMSRVAGRLKGDNTHARGYRGTTRRGQGSRSSG